MLVHPFNEQFNAHPSFSRPRWNSVFSFFGESNLFFEKSFAMLFILLKLFACEIQVFWKIFALPLYYFGIHYFFT